MPVTRGTEKVRHMTAAQLYPDTAALPRRRRKYFADWRCQDCGRLGATVIKFWATGMLYRTCPTCTRAYRGVILKAPRDGEDTTYLYGDRGHVCQ